MTTSFNARPHDPATLMAVLFPHGYTAPAESPRLPRVEAAPFSRLDDGLDLAAGRICTIANRGRRAIPATTCEHTRSEAFQDAVSRTWCAGFQAADTLAAAEPVVAALVVEIYARASSSWGTTACNLRAEVLMQLSAVESARRLQHLVRTEATLKLHSMTQGDLLDTVH